MPALARRTWAAGTWNCPTLAIYEILARQDGGVQASAIIENRRYVVAELHRAGARLLAGTDAGIDLTQPGSSLHDELAALVNAGLTPYEALRTATVDAAAFLGASTDIGTVNVGRRADLLLLRANPLNDVKALADPVMVFARGQRVR